MGVTHKSRDNSKHLTIYNLEDFRKPEYPIRNEISLDMLYNVYNISSH